MRLSDLDKKIFRKDEALANKEQGTRDVELHKRDVLQALSRDGELANKKMDELPDKIRRELSGFFNKDFWRKNEVSNG